MPGPYEKHVFVCTNSRPAGEPSCGHRGGLDVQLRFKERLEVLGLKTRVRANQSGCLDNCRHGVMVVIYPRGIWYGGVTVKDVDELIETSILHDGVVERLRLKATPSPA